MPDWIGGARRLRLIVWESDTSPVEFWLAITALFRGAAIVAVDYHDSRIVTAAMGDVPQWVWATAMLTLGSTALCALASGSIAFRLTATLTALMFWCFLSYRFALTVAVLTLPTFLPLVAMALWVFVRLQAEPEPSR